ncbi:MAG: hypothetical protein IIA35_01875 [Proteobacteria bacterium]|nr:hypothetical protein [Pseudomonadota bacterium]
MSKHGRIGIAALRSGMHRNTAHKYAEAGKTPSQPRQPRTWRTREDPFAEDRVPEDEERRSDQQQPDRSPQQPLVARRELPRVGRHSVVRHEQLFDLRSRRHVLVESREHRQPAVERCCQQHLFLMM